MTLRDERDRELEREGRGRARGEPDGTPFEVFFETERIRLYRVLFAITGSRQEAEDISQGAFLRVWERWDRVAVLDEPVGQPPSHGDERVRDRRRRLVLGLKRVLRPPAVLSATSCSGLTVTAAIKPVIGRRAFGIPLAEASRDEC